MSPKHILSGMCLLRLFALLVGVAGMALQILQVFSLKTYFSLKALPKAKRSKIKNIFGLNVEEKWSSEKSKHP